MQGFTFPHWIQGVLVDDALFLQAYESLSAAERARLKHCIAVLHACSGHAAALESCRTVRHAQGFVSRRCTAPLPWTLLLLPEEAASPSQLLATVLPPLLAGVPELLVLRVGAGARPLPLPLLAALELAGVEQVGSVTPLQLEQLLQQLVRGTVPGALLLPQVSPDLPEALCSLVPRAPHIRFWRGATPPSVGILATPETAWDWAALVNSNPAPLVELWLQDVPAPRPLPTGWRKRKGDVADFLASRHACLYAPAALHGQALTQGRLVLGPGQEGCWLWPDLLPHNFLLHSAALGPTPTARPPDPANEEPT